MRQWDEPMNKASREQYLEVLRNPDVHDRTEVFEALFKLHHNPAPGDEQWIYPLLKHNDPYVAKQALYALSEVYDHRQELRDLILEWSLGDPRDECEMPIQLEAIGLLSQLAANGDREAYERLWRIAQDPTMHESPQTAALEKLAEMHGIEWSDRDLDAIYENPFSEASEAVRRRIREAIREKGGWESLQRPRNQPEE